MHLSIADFGSAPRARAIREHMWRHIENLLSECQGIAGLRGSHAVTLLRDDLLRAGSGSDQARSVLLATFPSSRTPTVASTACIVPFLLDPAAALGRHPPWYMKLQCLTLTAAFLLSVSTAAFTRLHPSACMLANLGLPASSSIHSWFLRLRFSSVSAPALLPAPAPVLHTAAPPR